jgi:hypothetical protein
MASIDDKTLDTILALQLTVGWAGEKAAEPERLGWWDTDLTDKMAGGDLFSRLLPKTAAWAGLELARRAALQADRSARENQLARPDQVWTLYHFGFELDEALQDRLDHLKRHGGTPSDVFSNLWGVGDGWSRDGFESFLKGLEKAQTEDSPAGRQIKKLPQEPYAAAQVLAAALLPLAKEYPLPHGSAPSEKAAESEK